MAKKAKKMTAGAKFVAKNNKQSKTKAAKARKTLAKAKLFGGKA